MEHSEADLGFCTRAIHTGYDGKKFCGALNVPVFMTSTYEFDNVEQGGSAFEGKDSHPIYARLGSPTLSVLEQRIASLEGAEAGACFASGIGAISSVCWTFLGDGDHVIISDILYGCTWSMFMHAKDFGVEVDPVAFKNVDNVISKVRPDTRMIYFETPANPDNLVIDIKAIVETARAISPKCLIVVDNTYATPAITRPIELGCDIVVHSATKYLSGHGDLIGGLAVGRKELMDQVKMSGLKDMTGAVMSPITAHLLLRGLKTLKIRMEQHSATAMKVAEYLENNRHVRRVLYPFLKSSPYYELANKQMSMPHAMLCFELEGSFDNAKRFMNALKMIKIAVSLGDCETLIENPATMTHASMTAEELAASGITPEMLRLSIGLENTEDVLADLAQAFAAAFGEK